MKPIAVFAETRNDFGESVPTLVRISTEEGEISLNQEQWQELVAVMSGKRFSALEVESGQYSWKTGILSNESLKWQIANGGPKGINMSFITR